MSDSLRDQLMQAGFTAPKEPVRAKQNHAGKSAGKAGKASSKRGKSTDRRKGMPSHTPSPQRAANNNSRTASSPAADAEAARRKAIKTQIKTLIEAAAIKEFQGECLPLHSQQANPRTACQGGHPAAAGGRLTHHHTSQWHNLAGAG